MVNQVDKSGNYISSTGETVNIVDLLLSKGSTATPLYQDQHNILNNQPALTGNMVASDGKVYNLVDLIQNISGGGSGGDISQATETVLGGVRIATAQEVSDGTSDTDAVTPLKLEPYLSELSSHTDELALHETDITTLTTQTQNIIKGDYISTNNSVAISKNDSGVTLSTNGSLIPLNGSSTQTIEDRFNNFFPWNYRPDNKDLNEIIERGCNYTIHSQAGLNAPIEWTSGSVPWIVFVDNPGGILLQTTYSSTSGYPDTYRRTSTDNGSTWSSWVKLNQSRFNVVGYATPDETTKTFIEIDLEENVDYYLDCKLILSTSTANICGLFSLDGSTYVEDSTNYKNRVEEKDTMAEATLVTFNQSASNLQFNLSQPPSGMVDLHIEIIRPNSLFQPFTRATLEYINASGVVDKVEQIGGIVQTGCKKFKLYITDGTLNNLNGINSHIDVYTRV